MKRRLQYQVVTSESEHCENGAVSERNADVGESCRFCGVPTLNDTDVCGSCEEDAWGRAVDDEWDDERYDPDDFFDPGIPKPGM